MIATLKDSKAKLSSLVERASRGEEIVITVHGQPKARLMPVSSGKPRRADRSKWLRRLTAAQKKWCIGVHDSKDILDELRSDRLAIAERCFASRLPVYVRTLDSLHLATALILRCGAIATTDERMKTAAKILGLPVAVP